MAKEDKNYLPQSTAGLIRYFDVEEQITIKPEHVIALALAFAGIVIVLKFLA